MNLLKELKKRSNPENPYVFLSDERYQKVLKKWQELTDKKKEEDWTNSMMLLNTNRKLTVYCKKAGIVTADKLSAQCLRKSYGTNLANLGTPVHTLKELMGHSNIQTTMEYYLKSMDANKKKAVEGLDGLMND